MFRFRSSATAVLAGVLLAACSVAPSAPAVPTESDHVKGPANADVTLVAYGDYQCPACAFFHPITEQIADRYSDRVAFAHRHFPLENIHPNALLASEAAEAAGAQGKFWEMHDLLYSNQSAWSSLAAPTDTFSGYAQQLGLDLERFRQDLSSRRFQSGIRATYQQGLALGVNSTPTFFLNGQKVQDTPRSYGAFQAMIDAALMEAGTTTAPAPAPEAVPQPAEEPQS